jgi:nicotinate phosphoribosyltransferase
MGERKRLAPETFRLPVEKIRDSYYSDSYFALTKELLEAEGRDPQVIVVSGGFTAEKIESFEEVEAPVDSYGVGSALLLVCFEGEPGAKVGRELRPNPRLEPVA